MQDEILRIKQKDFTALDNKLFENLQKADYLNSTLSNLQQFQKFLMNQISLYDKKENSSLKKAQKQSLNKEEKYTKDQKEIIIQNCQNLKKSILRVMPIQAQVQAELQTQFFQHKNNNIQSKTQKQANFSRTKNTKFSYSRILNQPKSSLVIKGKGIQQNIKYQRLIKEISQLRAELLQLSRSSKKNITILQQENKNYIKKNVQSLLIQNDRLKKQNCKLLRDNQQKSHSVKELSKKNAELQRKISSWEQAKSRMNSRCASIDKQIQSSLKSSYQYQFQEQSQQKSLQSYKCFKQKLELNFTSKLAQSQLHVQQNKENKSQTFRQQLSSATLKSQNLINKNHFISVQLNRKPKTLLDSCNTKAYQNDNQNLDNHELPRPLRRHSISNSLTKEASSTSNLHNSQILKQITKASGFQNVQKSLNVQDDQKLLNKKKSNHDLARKTKSNFFKSKTDAKNQQNLIQNLSEATQKAVKIKGLQQKRQRNPSKQKLRIFSFL